MERHEKELLDLLDVELRKQGYDGKFEGPQAPMMKIDAEYRHPGGASLLVECKRIHLYRAEEFRGLIGDTILRIQHAGLLAPNKRLMVAFLLARLSRNAERDLQDYANRFMPDLQWLLLAEDGRGRLHLDGRDWDIEADKPLRQPADSKRGQSRSWLFSPKAQWLWKLLLMPGLDERYWGGPSQRPKSVNDLAKLSNVSQPAVSTFLMRAEAAGFLRRGPSGFIVERHRELLDDWVFAIKQGRRKVLPLRFVYPDEPEEKWLGKVRFLCGKQGEKTGRPPLVVGFHLACHLLGLGRSNVRQPWLYSVMEPKAVMAALDLAPAEQGEEKLSLVVPPSPDSIFGSFVRLSDVPICDALQCYLDVQQSHARGLEQADVIMNRVLRPHFEGRK